jgi:hypothetical protein
MAAVKVVELEGVFSISANARRAHHRRGQSGPREYGRTESDSLVHLDLGFKFHNLTNLVDGVLGQTYRPGYVNKLDIKTKMPVMGGTSKYVVSGGLFSTDCKVSRFHRNSSAASARRAWWRLLRLVNQ